MSSLRALLFQVASDVCFEDQTALDSLEGATVRRPRLKGKQKEGMNVLGVVTSHDIGRLERELRLGCMCDGRCVLRKAAVLRPSHRHDVFLA